MMKTKLVRVLAALTAVAFMGLQSSGARGQEITLKNTAGAVVIEVVPAAALVNLGLNFNVEVRIRGLGNGTALSAGAFDLVLAFDPAVISLNSTTLGNELGDVGLGEVVTGMVPGAGDVNVFAVSLLPPATLDANQPPDFPLFTANFNAASIGTSPLTISLNAPVGNALGAPITSTQIDSSVEVIAPPVQQIPTLSQWGLLLMAVILAAAAAFRIQKGIRRGDGHAV